MEQKKEEKPFGFSSLVAGVGFEPHDLRVMSPTSYRLLYPAILDCKYTDNFRNCKFLLQKFQNFRDIVFSEALLLSCREVFHIDDTLCDFISTDD